MGKIGIIGTGIFGTALAITATRAGNEVLCWTRNKDVTDDINYSHINKKYMPDIPLPDKITATTDMQKVFDFNDVILLTTTAQATREVLRQIKPFLRENTVLVFCAKGIEAESGKMLSEIADEEISGAKIAVLSGPGFAIDIAKQKFVSVTIGSQCKEIAEMLAQTLGTPYFRPYITTDIIAPQIGGSVKNVIAIAAGIVKGAALGDGVHAALITRGLAEMARLSAAIGGDLQTIMGMCGLGDLVMTASCPQSRNFSFGYEIGVCGSAYKPLRENTRTVEGIYTAKAVVKRAGELNIEMPICEMINRTLSENISVQDAVKELFSRSYKKEGIFR